MDSLLSVFKDQSFKESLQKELPLLLLGAESYFHRSGGVNLAVGLDREYILFEILSDYLKQCGILNAIRNDVGAYSKGVDWICWNESVSVKSIGGKKSNKSIKLAWNDNEINESPENILLKDEIYPVVLLDIHWNDRGGLYYIPSYIIRNIIKNKHYIKGGNSKYNKGISISIKPLIQQTDHSIIIDFPPRTIFTQIQKDTWKFWKQKIPEYLLQQERNYDSN